VTYNKKEGKEVGSDCDYQKSWIVDRVRVACIRIVLNVWAKNNIGGTAAIAASFGFFSGFTFGKDEKKS
jgi:hypothetical protein